MIDGNIHSLVIKGPGGTGKTTAILEKLSENSLVEDRHYVYIAGHITPLRLYQRLLDVSSLESPRLIIFDDIDSLLSNKTSIALLKGAVSEARGKRTISYETTSIKVDAPSFEFNGKVILIANSFVHNEAIRPLLDRAIFYDMITDPAIMGEYIRKNISQFGGKDIPEREKISVWDKIRRFIRHPMFSFRAVNRALTFYKHDADNWYKMWQATMTA